MLLNELNIIFSHNTKRFIHKKYLDIYNDIGKQFLRNIFKEWMFLFSFMEYDLFKHRLENIRK